MVLVSSLFSLGAAQAQTLNRVDQREVRQEARIERGVASGQLTLREAARLNAEQARIDRTEARAKADGRITAAERRFLNQAQNRASQNIYAQVHDRQMAPLRR